MFITFIYKIGKNKKTYYRKYIIDYISDDYDGLDPGLQSFNLCIKKIKIYIGILSLIAIHIPTYSSYNNSATYINGDILF